MSYALANRVMAVRARWPKGQPPAASLIYAVLHRRAARKNTADIADALGKPQALVARICEVDQDIRYEARCCRKEVVRLPA